MEKQITQVLAFQKNAEAPTPEVPTMLDPDRFELRCNLMAEEMSEMIVEFESGNMTGIADALADQLYILLGTVIEFGLAGHFPMLFNEVHRSNMTKFDPDTKKFVRRDDGKILKPETYSPPNLARILERDFSVYKAVQDNPNEGLKADWDAFMEKVNDTIRKNLNVQDRALYDTYIELEKQLEQKVNVNLDSSGIDFSAVVKVYDNEVEVRG